MTLPRRRFLLAGSAAVLVGCAPDRGARVAEPTSSEVASSQPPSAAPNRPSPSPTTAAASSSPTPALPTREELVARFEGREPAWFGLEGPGIVARTDAPGVCLTFDLCGGKRGSGLDEALVDVLMDFAVPATFFMNQRWLDADPARARELASEPLFEIANHGTRHQPLSVDGREAYGIAGTANVGELVDEVTHAGEALAGIVGERPRWFRSGTAHVDDVAVDVCEALGVRIVNFDVNADAGATLSAEQVVAVMRDARKGSITIAHANRPGSGTAAGMREAVARILDDGLRCLTLSQAMPA